MANITVDYFGQFRSAAGGIASETLELGRPTSVESLIRQLAERHGEAFDRLVSIPGGGQASFLCFLDQQPAQMVDDVGGRPNSVLTLMSPIAGG